MNWSDRYGFWRSWLMYYGKPFNRKKLKKFYSQFIKSGDLAFDIGAHLGNRSQAWLDLGAKVIAVEPQPMCIQFLKKNFSRHQNFKLLPFALGNEEAVIDFKISHRNPTISTARDQAWQKNINQYSTIKASWEEIIQVKQYTLNRLILDYGLPRFCKVDTEGFEWEVIQGLDQAIPQLSLEFLAFDHQRTICCIERLASIGNYQLNFSFGESQKFYWANWKLPNEVIDFISAGQYPKVFGDLYFKLS